MRISAALPQGVTALLFATARRRRRLEDALVARLEAAGFDEVMLPILDYLEPYEPLLTAESRGELYRFVDRDGELLALRADFTPLLARLLAPLLDGAGVGAEAGDGTPALALPLRLYYRGDVVRYEGERRGRRRESYQVGAELLGDPGDAAEREMLDLFLTLLTAGRAAAGEAAPPLRVVLGFAGALDAPLAAAAAEGADPERITDALSRRERATFRAPGGAAAVGWRRVLRAVLERGVPDEPAELGPEAAGRLVRLTTLRDEMAARHPAVELAIDLAELGRQRLDPVLAPAGEPGLSALGERSYYDGIVFRAYAGSLAAPAGAGGRYDRLFRRLGAEVPAVGFTLGLDRLADGAELPAPAAGALDEVRR